MDYHKLFGFTSIPDCTVAALDEIQPNSSPPAQDGLMMKMKDELNSVKNKLCEYDIAEWSQHTTRMDPASKVVRTVTSMIRPKPFCSNAWCKFYELLSTLRLLDEVDKSTALHSVHLCEAPGGFICALNHFIQSAHRGMEHQWLANTLNPYNEKCKLGEMIPDDRLIRHSIDKWLFGVDNTGDLTKADNMNNIIEQARQQLCPTIQLVTADGSLDCQLNPAEQEMIVYPLILAEVYTALSLLSPGGVAVIKMFTMFESHTIALLYTLNVLFDKVQIHKPVTSKPGNSEVYVVCKGRVLTISDQVLSLFKSAMASGLPLVSLCNIPETFLQQMRAAAEEYKQRQVETILYNIQCCENKKLVPIISNEKNAREFISKMNLKSISNELGVLSASERRAGYPSRNEEPAINSYGSEISHSQCQPRKRRLSGNFTQRCKITAAEHRLTKLLLAERHSIQPIRFLYTIETSCPHNHSPVDACEAINVVLVPRLEITDTRISNSQFTDGPLLSDYNILADSCCDVISQTVKVSDVESITEVVFSSLSDCQQCIYISNLKEINLEKGNKLIVAVNPLMDLTSLVDIFKAIQTGDNLLVHSVNCLLRQGAGLVYLLWHCFDEIAIAGHNTGNHLPSILFKRCIISYGERVRCLEILQQQLVSVLTDDWTALTLVSTPTIIHCKQLYSYFLSDINIETLRRAINDLMCRAEPPSTTM